MFARINSLGVYALNGFSVSVEADISGGLPQFTIVGLPDSAVREATDRVRSALKNLSFVWPVSRITVNLAPGDIRKTGPVYDLPVLPVSYTHLRAHETGRNLVCRLLLEKKKIKTKQKKKKKTQLRDHAPCHDFV